MKTVTVLVFIIFFWLLYGIVDYLKNINKSLKQEWLMWLRLENYFLFGSLPSLFICGWIVFLLIDPNNGQPIDLRIDHVFSEIIIYVMLCVVLPYFLIYEFFLKKKILFRYEDFKKIIPFSRETLIRLFIKDSSIHRIHKLDTDRLYHTLYILKREQKYLFLEINEITELFKSKDNYLNKIKINNPKQIEILEYEILKYQENVNLNKEDIEYIIRKNKIKELKKEMVSVELELSELERKFDQKKEEINLMSKS